MSDANNNHEDVLSSPPTQLLCVGPVTAKMTTLYQREKHVAGDDPDAVQ